jgi:hypothetical protein
VAEELVGVDGPLPIDMGAMRGAIATLSAAGEDVADLEPAARADYASYQDFIAKATSMPSECYGSLVRACRATLDGPGTARTLPGRAVVRAPFLHHGDLTVPGDLLVRASLVVTGSLTVAGILDDMGPDSRIAVGGDLTARGVDTDGELYVGGTIEADVVHGYYNDNVLAARTIRARLVIEDDHAVIADVDAEFHFDIDTYRQGYGDGVQERLRAILVDEVFAPGDDDVARLDRDALFAALGAGRPVFRADTV